METPAILLDLLIILVSARICGEIAAHLGIPSVIGELCAGILIGPSLLGWVEPSAVLHVLAQLGIIMMLFHVGLETDMHKLVHAGVRSAVTATTGFVLPFVLAFAAATWIFHQDQLVAMFIGGTLTATSIGITVRVLTDLKRAQSAEGQIVLGAAVLDDVLGVALLALLYQFTQSGGVSLVNAGRVLFFISIFFFLAPVAARLISGLIRRFGQYSEISGLIPTAMVALVLFFSWLAHTVGAPELLGGFAAGLALSRRFFLPFGLSLNTDPAFSQRIAGQMRPIIQLFTPIFFVMVGLSLNLQEIDWRSAAVWIFTLVYLVIAIVSKLFSATLLPDPWRMKLVIGMSMIPRGEVGLVFAELGRVSGTLDNETYAGLILVIALSTLLPPFAIKAYYARHPQ